MDTKTDKPNEEGQTAALRSGDLCGKLAADILAGSEHDAIRWHGEDSEGQWCWQYRDARDVAKMIEREIAPLLRALIAARECIEANKRHLESIGRHCTTGTHQVLDEIENALSLPPN